MDQENGPSKETEIILEEWKTVINTQMHFNEMIMRARTTGVSVVMAVYGAAALAYGQYPNRFYDAFGSRFHVSTAIILFGLLLLISIFIIDYHYYYRLLIGAVERGEEIDKAYRDRIIDGTKLFGLTSSISNRVSRNRARICLFFFYGTPLLVGMVSLVYLLRFYRPYPFGIPI
jgi:ABC-type amino acid transport system permease subunit